MFEFKLPDLGEGIHEGELIQWHVKKADHIKEDDPLCDMETDKALVTIPSPRTGTVSVLNGNPGDIIEVGQVLAVIETDDKDASKDQAPVPDLPLTEPVKTGQQEKPTASSIPETSQKETVPPKRAVAAPVTRRIAREMNIDINRVTGTGPGGRVTREDLDSFNKKDGPAAGIKDDNQKIQPINSDASPQTAPGIPFFENPVLPNYETQGPVDKEPVRSLRKKTAAKTTSSMIMIPHVAHMDEINVTELEALRRVFNKDKPKEEHLTLMSFVIKAVASLLKEFPQFNASLDSHNMEIIYKKFYHIGFAADTPRGLMVPVIRDADRKNVVSIGRGIRFLAQKGRDGTITIDELSHGTFSVTNVGVIGGTGVVPTINAPESAILGMGQVRKKPVVIENEIRIGRILPVTLSFDHRIADGVKAALFVRSLKQMLENPMAFMTGI